MTMWSGCDWLASENEEPQADLNQVWEAPGSVGRLEKMNPEKGTVARYSETSLRRAQVNNEPSPNVLLQSGVFGNSGLLSSIGGNF